MQLRNTVLAAALVALITPYSVSAADLTAERLRAYYAAWSAGDVDAVMSYFADSIVYEDVATGDLSKGREEVRAFAKGFLDGTPGVAVVPTSILIGPTSAAVEWTMSAGEGEDAWSVRGVAVMKHADGKITRATDYWDAE